MYCDFQPAFLFLLTQGTKRKRSSAMLIMKQKIYYIIKKIENWACKESQFPRAAGYVATRLMCRLICNLPELSIRIYLIRLLPI